MRGGEGSAFERLPFFAGRQKFAGLKTNGAEMGTASVRVQRDDPVLFV